jgi:hypothetical protein
MSAESEYKLENVAAKSVAADKIDATFRSSTIGEYKAFAFRFSVSHARGISL